MEPSRLLYKKSSIGWYRFGSGPVAVACFHGYGEHAGSFEFLEKHAGDRFSFYSIDLPFHGHTEWREGLDFTPDDLAFIVDQIIHNRQFHIIGYSLGGRVGLCLYELFPERVKKIVLLAPDGLKVNPWYWFSTQTVLGNKLFHFTMKHPSWFFGLLKLFNKLGVVNASVFKFVKHYIGDGNLRDLLYRRWTSLRKLKPRLPHIKRLVKERQTSLSIIYGEHDRIILSQVGWRFRKGIEENCSVSVIQSGHQVLHEKHIREILSALLT